MRLQIVNKKVTSPVDDFGRVQGHIASMVTDIPKNNLRKLRTERGWTLDHVAGLLVERFGGRDSKVTVGRHETRGRSLSIKQIKQYAEIYGCSANDIVEPDSGGRQVPVIGYVGAGGSVIFEDQFSKGDGFDFVDRPAETKGTLIGLEVRGESQLGRFHPGDVVFITDTDSEAPSAYVGKFCVVRLKSGESYLKRLAAGSADHLFHLVSTNAEIMIDQEVDWARPVQSVRINHNI